VTGGGEPMEPLRHSVFPSGELAIVWADGEETYVGGYDLRCACSCAQCVEEMTGRALLDPTSVPRDVRPVEVHPVGRYGFGIRFSDGHDTGIYAFSRLRALGAGDG
jgi:ATP-binding protein involved in chromosome partitioning